MSKSEHGRLMESWTTESSTVIYNSLDLVFEGYCRWKLSSGNLYTIIRPNQEQLPKMQMQNRNCSSAIPVQRSNQLSYRGQLSSSNHMQVHVYILGYIEHCTGIAGSIPARDP
jgi:hypothetical protein